VKSLAVAVWAALLLVIPSVAAACPNCVGASNRNTTILKLVGLFMLVPFAVFYAVVRVIRRAQRETEQIDSPEPL
jgi:hypothetical protein